MKVCFVRRCDVTHDNASGNERVGDPEAVTMRRIRLGAHQRDALRRRKRDDAIDSMPELGRAHVVGEAARALAAASRTFDYLLRGPSTSKLLHMLIEDSRRRHRLRHYLPIELR